METAETLRSLALPSSLEKVFLCGSKRHTSTDFGTVGPPYLRIWTSTLSPRLEGLGGLPGRIWKALSVCWHSQPHGFRCGILGPLEWVPRSY